MVTNETNQGNWVDVGRHRVRFEPPDLIYGELVGAVDVAEANAVWDVVWSWIQETPNIYWIGNISKFGHYRGTAIRGMNDAGWSSMRKIRAMAFVGGNHRQRATLSLLIPAIKVLGAFAEVPELAYFGNDTDAHHFIHSIRKRHEARVSK